MVKVLFIAQLCKLSGVKKTSAHLERVIVVLEIGLKDKHQRQGLQLRKY